MGRTGWHVLMGTILGSAANGLRQDIMGRDAYLKSVESGWVSWHWSVPLNVLVALVMVLAIWSEMKAEREGR